MPTRINPTTCEKFSSSYIDYLKRLKNTYEFKEDISDIHSEISNLALADWKQTASTLTLFSNHFISFFKTRLWLQCGLFTNSQNSPQIKVQKDPNQLSVERISYIPTEFQNCVFNTWENSKNLIFQSCMLYLSEE